MKRKKNNLRRRIIKGAFYFHFVIIYAFSVTGCVGTEKQENPQAVKSVVATASCNECHSYPGSQFCRTDTLRLGSGVYTQCYACHVGSIEIDSTYDSAFKSYVFHDVMFANNKQLYPRTGPRHTQGFVNLNFAQCTFCHSYPPATGLHKRHVFTEGKQCYECHFATAVSDTQADSVTGEMYFSPRMRTVPGGGELPQLDQKRHIDNSIEVSFRKKYQNPQPAKNSFLYNRSDKNCSNILCHSGTTSGGASVERTIWKDTLQ
jgi:predicted CxxxxCH...CXXCH cytochrome family protein